MKEELMYCVAEDNAAITELKKEHGSLFVNGMVAKGKALLFSGGELQTVFQKEHLVVLRYALTSLGIYSYNTIYSFIARERKLVFHFSAEDIERLKREHSRWKGQ